MDKISVIVPCFNEEDVVALFYKETSKVLQLINNVDYELLFITVFTIHSLVTLEKKPLCLLV